ncbi:MAG: LytTR family DNA-binding domain-containing protein [Clostridium sp.]|nr:LytTR family DNA-binding domain-containing protein [Clostridium sp.]
MISVLACDRKKDEVESLREDCRHRIAKSSDEKLDFSVASGDEDLQAVCRDQKLLDVFYYEFRKGQPIGTLREFRKAYGETLFMLITEATVSPLEYLKPGIAPDSLLLRPCDRELLCRVNAELMDSFFEKFHAKDAEESFVVDTREEKRFIPYGQIYYFEARDKKLFVRIRHEEYAFYDTIDALQKRLPEDFRRCHRSYIVNTKKIRKIYPADNYIELEEDIGVPLSRSYKPSFGRKGEA